MPTNSTLWRSLALITVCVSLAAVSAPVHANPPPRQATIEYAHQQELEESAMIVAGETGVPFFEVLEEWEDDDQTGLSALHEALQQLGKPYRYAKRGPTAFDCSGLMDYAWGTEGVDLPWSSGPQHRSTFPIDEVQAGALVWRPGHIAMSLGIDNYIVHAANSKTGVVISTMDASLTYPIED